LGGVGGARGRSQARSKNGSIVPPCRKKKNASAMQIAAEGSLTFAVLGGLARGEPGPREFRTAKRKRRQRLSPRKGDPPHLRKNAHADARVERRTGPPRRTRERGEEGGSPTGLSQSRGRKNVTTNASERQGVATLEKGVIDLQRLKKTQERPLVVEPR